ncbi:MAG: restriction endonuclease subunit S [Halothiobacillaceae bacterium]
MAEVNPDTALPLRDLDDLPVPFYEMAAIDEHSGKLRDPAIVPLRDCRAGKTEFQNGDVLFAKITPCVQNRKSALVNGLPGNFACGSSEFYVLRPGKRVMPEYLFYFIRQDAVIHAAVESFTGTSGRQRVPRTFWDCLEIPLPPLPVQERIVEILQKADEIRRKRKEALELADKILPAIFLEMFGDPATNPKGWEKLTIGEVASMVTSGFTPRGGARNYVAEGPLLLRSQNVHMLSLDLSDCAHLPESIFDEMERVHIQPGDVLMNITGKGTAGRVTWVEDAEIRAAVNQHVCIIRCKKDKILAPFLAITLSTPHYQAIIDRAPGSTQSGFNHSRVRALEVIVPPIPVQSSFVAQVAALREVIQKHLSTRHDAERAFASLLSQAFTGELTAEWEAANADWIAERQAFYERLPRLVVLALIAEKVKRARRSAEVLVTALMKYAFLFQMEGQAARRSLYHFVPYHYGPFAKELYADLAALQNEGLVRVENDAEEDKTKITLADPAKAEEALSTLPDDLKEAAARIIETYGDLNHNALLETVYEKYPAYARKSRLKRKGRRTR